jgi:hypothetical protein
MSEKTYFMKADLLRWASERTGRNVNENRLRYALKTGRVNPAVRRPDGWFLYDEKSLDDLCRYVLERGRVSTQSVIA